MRRLRRVSNQCANVIIHEIVVPCEITRLWMMSDILPQGLQATVLPRATSPNRQRRTRTPPLASHAKPRKVWFRDESWHPVFCRVTLDWGREGWAGDDGNESERVQM